MDESAEQATEGTEQDRGHPAPRSAGRRRRGARTLLVVVVVLLLASSCRATVHQRIDTARATAGRDPVTTSASLEAAAGARANAMCAARSATASPDPLAEFDAETASAADDLAGSAPLDPSITDGAARNIAATEAVVAGWGDDPLLTDARWDDVGVGEATCPDGRLYVSAAFTQRPTMPATGRYSSPVYSSSQITVRRALQYGTAPTYLGVVQPLLLDVWTPPAGSGPRPLVVLVHGGGFQGGTRDQWDGGAMDFATRGYVVASISYRLRPASQPLLPKAADAIDDGMESIRWLKANAATYGIDTTRIAMMGTSAGGVVALGVALADDPTPGGPLAAVSPRIDAAVSTGAHLTPGLSTLTLGPDEPRHAARPLRGRRHHHQHLGLRVRDLCRGPGRREHVRLRGGARHGPPVVDLAGRTDLGGPQRAVPVRAPPPGRTGLTRPAGLEGRPGPLGPERAGRSR